MNAVETNVLLTKIALVDRWFKRSPAEQADMAEAWSGILADVPLEVGVSAVDEHYATERRSIMPADILDAMPPLRSSSYAGNITEQRLAAEAAGQKALEPGDV